MPGGLLEELTHLTENLLKQVKNIPVVLSTALQNQNLGQIGLGVLESWSDLQTIKQANKQRHTLGLQYYIYW